MRDKIHRSIQESVRAVEQLFDAAALDFIESVSKAVAACFVQGGKLIIAGNGGSLCDAAHFAEELTGLFRSKRRALPALVLSEPGHLTCVANDLGYDEVFARGVEAFGKPGDLFIGLTTSGNSPNIVRAFDAAKRLGLQTVAFLGKSGGVLRGAADWELLIAGFATSDRIQEAHMAAIHILIEMVEEILFAGQEPRPIATIAASLGNLLAE